MITLDNTEILFQRMVAKHPDTESDLRRLIQRVVMDVRNNINRVNSDIELLIDRMPAVAPEETENARPQKVSR